LRAGDACPRGLADRPFLALMVTAGLVTLSVDFFLTGMPIYVLLELRSDPWIPGTAVAVLTALTSVGATFTLRLTRNLRRTTAMAIGAALIVLWCLLSMGAVLVPGSARPVVLLVATVVLGSGSLFFGARANAMAVALTLNPRGFTQ
jgi:Na+/melibiose symporter-like transporter